MGGWPPARRSRLARLFDADGVFDEGLLSHFPAPASYTGEDVVELSCHGNPVLVERLVAAAVAAGARLAEPGEFTRRAVLSGRMDLTRAEAVLQTIEARTQRGAAVARAGLDGAVADAGDALRSALIDVVAELEARLDYPGEDLTTQHDAALAEQLQRAADQAQGLADTWTTGRRLVHGATVALVGPVNAGKSSLFNALVGSTRALVSDQPGTTRDVIERQVWIQGVAVTLLDTAGDRAAQGLEAQGQALGAQLTADADLIVVVVPAHDPSHARETLARTAHRSRLVVGNHSDRPGALAGWQGVTWIPTSATTGQGLDALRRAIAAGLVDEEPGEHRVIVASQRQHQVFSELAGCCRRARAAHLGPLGPAVAAEELLGGLEALDALSGRDTREDALDRLFARFCIGK